MVFDVEPELIKSVAFLEVLDLEPREPVILSVMRWMGMENDGK